MRWLHIYLSMFSLAVILFFSLTGVTLNHPDWFGAGAERITEAEGMLDRGWLDADVRRGEEAGGRRAPAQGTHGVAGRLADFRVDDDRMHGLVQGAGLRRRRLHRPRVRARTG